MPTNTPTSDVVTNGGRQHGFIPEPMQPPRAKTWQHDPDRLSRNKRKGRLLPDSARDEDESSDESDELPFAPLHAVPVHEER